jgi:asparagine synthase (glutamine-hydrolysing)
MGAVALIADFAGRPVASGELGAMLGALAHRGSDGQRSVGLGWVAVGHRHFWATPEDEGERQPIEALGLWLALDGRIDNRGDLIAALELGSEGARRSDAALLLEGYRRWGTGVWQRCVGAFAAVVVETLARRVVLARDALGERSIFYRFDGGRLCVASEEGALLADGETDGELDFDTVLRFLALEPPRVGATFWKGVCEVPPGCTVIVDAAGTRTSRYWSFNGGRAGRRSDGEWIEELETVLASAVAAQVRARGRCAVMLSGGLDSSSVAALASASGGCSPVAYSWIFDELASCDERPYIGAVCERWRLERVEIPGDGLWPLQHHRALASSRGRPDANPYRELKQALYQRVAQDGHRVLLSGAAGDLLYAGADRAFLRSALADRRVALACSELVAAWRRRDARRPLRSLAGLLSPSRSLRRLHADRWPWLRSEARNALMASLASDGYPANELVAGASGHPRVASMMGAHAALGSSVEVGYAALAGVDLRDPYRDRRVVELFARMPDHLLYRAGSHKWALRVALGERLPALVRDRVGSAGLAPLFERGMAAVTGASRASIDQAPWRGWLDCQWVNRRLSAGAFGALPPRDAAALWSAVALARWRSDGDRRRSEVC